MAMLHPFHLFIDSLGFFVLEQSQVQISSNIDLKRKRIIRVDAQQLRWPGAKSLTRFGQQEQVRAVLRFQER